jgi:hypothetical protein
MAAAMVTIGEAAFRVLKHLGLKSGQTLVILGAGGAVGTVAVQLAVARGITVIGTAAEEDISRITAMGATGVRSGDGWADRVGAAAPEGVDAVFDTAGAGLLADAVAVAGTGGPYRRRQAHCPGMAHLPAGQGGQGPRRPRGRPQPRQDRPARPHGAKGMPFLIGNVQTVLGAGTVRGYSV